jgi:hypothetical protein
MFAQTDKTQLEYPAYARSLKPGHTYFWMVIPVSDDETLAGLPSKPAKFTLAGYRKLGIKGLYPCGDIPPGDREMVFNWTPVNTVNKYKLEIADNPGMNNPIISKETNEPEYLLEDSPRYFSGDRVYYWRVTPVFKSGAFLNVGAINKFRIEVVQ